VIATNGELGITDAVVLDVSRHGTRDAAGQVDRFTPP
jgi:hypothetical protein